MILSMYEFRINFKIKSTALWIDHFSTLLIFEVL